MMKKRWALLAVVLLWLIPGNLQAQNDRREVLTLAEVFLTQLDVAIQQASFGSFSTTLHEVQVQAHQVLNVAVGKADASFDTAVPNLGDSTGLLTYAKRLGRVLEQNPDFHEYQLTLDNIRFFVQAATEVLKATLKLRDPNSARRQIRIAQGLLLAARGTPGDLPSEGGVRTLLALLN